MHDGHRERLRRRFSKGALGGFAEHEILELMLFHAIPRRDTNPLAHALIDRFGSLRGVLSASERELMQVEGVGEASAQLIRLFAEVARYYFTDAEKSAVLDTSEKAARYLAARYRGVPQERMYLCCLDTRFRLTHEELVAAGSLSSLPVFPRQIASSALLHNAAYVLLAHNHPGGDPRPSRADIETTRSIVAALSPLGIGLLDHIIIGDGCYYSFSDTSSHTLHLQAAPPLAMAAQSALPREEPLPEDA